MTPAQSIKTCLRKYANISGRASRSEFWWYMLFHFFILHFARMLDIFVLKYNASFFIFSEPFATPVSTTAIIILLLPMFSVHWRRMHDISRPGWHAFYPLIIMSIGYLPIVAMSEIVKQAVNYKIGLDFMDEHSSVLKLIIYAYIRFLFIFAAAMSFVVVFWTCLRSQPNSNQFGPNPHEVTP